MSGKIAFVGLVFFLAQLGSVFAFAFPWWIPLCNIIWAVGLWSVRTKPEVNMVLTAAHFGLCGATLVFMPSLFWLVLTASAGLAVALIVKRFGRF